LINLDCGVGYTGLARRGTALMGKPAEEDCRDIVRCESCGLQSVVERYESTRGDKIFQGAIVRCPSQTAMRNKYAKTLKPACPVHKWEEELRKTDEFENQRKRLRELREVLRLKNVDLLRMSGVKSYTLDHWLAGYVVGGDSVKAILGLLERLEEEAQVKPVGFLGGSATLKIPANLLEVPAGFFGDLSNPAGGVVIMEVEGGTTPTVGPGLCVLPFEEPGPGEEVDASALLDSQQNRRAGSPKRHEPRLAGVVGAERLAEYSEASGRMVTSALRLEAGLKDLRAQVETIWEALDEIKEALKEKAGEPEAEAGEFAGHSGRLFQDWMIAEALQMLSSRSLDSAVDYVEALRTVRSAKKNLLLCIRDEASGLPEKTEKDLEELAK